MYFRFTTERRDFETHITVLYKVVIQCVCVQHFSVLSAEAHTSLIPPTHTHTLCSSTLSDLQIEHFV